MNTLMDTERRQSLRLPFDGPVEVETTSRAGWISGQGRDLSEGGLSIRLNERFDLHTVVRVRLAPPQARTPVECLARVAWTTARMDLAAEPPYPYDVGIEFVKVPSMIRRQIALAYEHLRQQPPPSPTPHLRPAIIGGQTYLPSVTYESVPQPMWHLIVRSDGVPCYAQRFRTSKETVASWQSFKQQRMPAPAVVRRRPRGR